MKRKAQTRTKTGDRVELSSSRTMSRLTASLPLFAIIPLAGFIVIAFLLVQRWTPPPSMPLPHSSLSATSTLQGQIPIHEVEIVRKLSHDGNSFTQGLLFDAHGRMFESSGRYGESSVREVDLETGRVLHSQRNPPQYFAEGLAEFDNKLIQLTWRENTAFIHDKENLQLLQTIRWPLEGWGVVYDGHQFITSDGSSFLSFVDPSNFTVTKRLLVTDHNGNAIRHLNELELIGDEIWANVFLTDYIARIDPSTGRINSWVHVPGLDKGPVLIPSEAFLNGIAYNQATQKIYLTGKLWHYLYEVRLREPPVMSRTGPMMRR